MRLISNPVSGKAPTVYRCDLLAESNFSSEKMVFVIFSAIIGSRGRTQKRGRPVDDSLFPESNETVSRCNKCTQGQSHSARVARTPCTTRNAAIRYPYARCAFGVFSRDLIPPGPRSTETRHGNCEIRVSQTPPDFVRTRTTACAHTQIVDD